MGYPEEDALWKYELLTEPLLSSELERLAGANSYQDTDCVTFQPCPDPEVTNQDRYAIFDWDLGNGKWHFRLLLDGHAGHETVDYVLQTLPQTFHNGLVELVSRMEPSADVVSKLLQDVITSLDVKLTQDLHGLFPDIDSFANLSDDAISAIINDQASGGKNASIVSRCMRGTTVLVALVDPGCSNLWVASLGDGQAALGVRQSDGSWEASVLSSFHNGENVSEKEQIFKEHPNEEGCVLKNRVLGAIAVTRAIGDHLFKLPSPYTERIFMNAKEGFQFSKDVQEFLGRNKTPPYLSNRADVEHIRLEGKETFLVLCSDGLYELYAQRIPLEHTDFKLAAKHWIQTVAEGLRSASKENLALYLLRDALGGDDIGLVSRMITVEMDEKWMDDTTILVQKLRLP
ncbi:hypothetical protein H0H92_008893 [Tricholoma furcatifolium]|nr:hypothetical protein H0H92_008893 [Tricholoma furcatifolium]